MANQPELILNKKQIQQKMRRIAYEIYEQNYREKRLVLAGITETGYALARMLARELKKISPFDLTLLRIDIVKDDPAHGQVKIEGDLRKAVSACIILVDDVLHTGRTFVHSLKPFLNIDTRRIQTAVLVDRSHKQYPIAADYAGYALSTTLSDHIEVSLNAERYGVYLY
jgi:pyrimidine operon attenuation protein / uracil phosphoribosyltransferase